jgi:hypothetical protein
MIYSIPDPEPGTVTAIASWSIKEVVWGDNELPTRHLIGFVRQEGAGRATSAVQSFDKEHRLIQTQSGRLYQLIGEPGQDGDAEYVWKRWRNFNGAQDEKDVTHEYWHDQ